MNVLQEERQRCPWLNHIVETGKLEDVYEYMEGKQARSRTRAIISDHLDFKASTECPEEWKEATLIDSLLYFECYRDMEQASDPSLLSPSQKERRSLMLADYARKQSPFVEYLVDHKFLIQVDGHLHEPGTQSFLFESWKRLPASKQQREPYPQALRHLKDYLNHHTRRPVS